MTHHHSEDESKRLFELLRDRALSDDFRLQHFEELLTLDHGFWRPDSRITLRTFMLAVGRAAQANAVARGARRDAIDAESLAHDVLLAFFHQAHRIKEPRAWLIGTAYRMLNRELGKNWGAYFVVEADAPRARQLVAPDQSTHAELGDERMRRVTDAMRSCLTPIRRRVMEFHLAGNTSTEIGAMLQMKPATVRKHLSRGKADLARALRDDQAAATDTGGSGEDDGPEPTSGVRPRGLHAQPPARR